ncbi:MAG: serine dehydratase subunit alpha family protein [Thermodesulfobacteriota bacterium]
MNISIKDILKLEVAPALGCTEPTAVALGGAAAASLGPRESVPDRIDIRVDPNIFKNGLAVNIPGTNGRCGLDLASALGCLFGDPKKKMQVLQGVKEADVQKAVELIASGKVKVDLAEDRHGIYVKTTVRHGNDSYVSIIETQHDHVTELYVNGNSVDNPFAPHPGKSQASLNVSELEAVLHDLSLEDALEISAGIDEGDMDFIERGIEMNMRLADFGLNNECGLQVGRKLRGMEGKWLNPDIVHECRVYTSAAADARMAGVPLPAMSSAGSGNHGLTAIIPIKLVADKIGASRRDLCRAVALSHVITACVKSHTGRLAAICACSVASGAGAASAVAWLLGGDKKQIGSAINNIIEDLAGVICDGAKNSCALKLATASGNAVTAAFFALNGLGVQATDGIIDASAMRTIANVGRMSSQGMTETDKIILKIMLDKFTDKK